MTRIEESRLPFVHGASGCSIVGLPFGVPAALGRVLRIAETCQRKEERWEDLAEEGG